MQLAPFWLAYNKPYPPALTWRELRAEGYEPKEHTTCGLQEIEESWDELIQYRVDEDGNITSTPGDRANWQERLINKWSRKKVWSL